MRLNDLIAELKKSPPGDYLRIDRSPVGLTPKSLESYRGYYDQAAIGVECERYGANVGDFVKLLEGRIGQMMTGYKGGDYTITPDTKVWISNYGEASDSRVTGVRREDWGCTFITWMNAAADALPAWARVIVAAMVTAPGATPSESDPK